MAPSSSFILLLALLFILVQSGLSQTIVSNSNCRGKPCGGSYSEKYCCASSQSGLSHFECCNPYIGLIIGLCVGFPLVIAIVVIVVILYCFCIRYRNHKIARMASALSSRSVSNRSGHHHHRRSRREEVEVDDDYAAPPPYTPVDTLEPMDSGLPAYTPTDPYKQEEQVPPPPADPFLVQQQQPPSPADHSIPSIIPLEDIPLLSEEES